MSKQRVPNIPPGWIVSKSTYKKLGTVIEHLIKNINCNLFEISIMTSGQQGITIIRLYPMGPYRGNAFPVWELMWTPLFNHKLIIDPNLLIPNHEW